MEKQQDDRHGVGTLLALLNLLEHVTGEKRQEVLALIDECSRGINWVVEVDM